ncbi:hypothetical protein PtB15_11B12 [Puccinia triticina]|nr:hypothetical protein PtB15_11B12 [Puccinia triticina]
MAPLDATSALPVTPTVVSATLTVVPVVSATLTAVPVVSATLTAVPTTTIVEPACPIIPIPPPPEKTYKSKEKLKEAIQDWAFHHGYAIATANSSFSRGKGKITFQCDLSGKFVWLMDVENEEPGAQPQSL